MKRALVNNFRALGWSFLTLPVFFAMPLSGQSAGPSVFDLLQREAVVPRVVLELDIEAMLARRNSDEEIPAVFSFPDEEGVQQSWDLDVNVRGNFRRMKCDFPPLKLNFSKAQLEDRNLSNHNNLKLVTHCLDDWRGEEYLLREYVIYQMYRRLTDTSYRAQLVEIEYRNTGKGGSLTRLGFLLEDEKELADRLDSELCEDCYAVPQERFREDLLAVHDLFQYLIGNADWSAKLLKNLKLLKPDQGGPFALVPYDFDYSGLVNPDYAPQPTHLGIRSLRERVYLGFPHPAPQLQRAYEQLLHLQPAFYALIKACPGLKKAVRREMQKYVESFYDQMARMAPDFEDLQPVSPLQKH